jgi:hypothetical protein
MTQILTLAAVLLSIMAHRPAVYFVIYHVLESLIVGGAQEDLPIVYTAHNIVHTVQPAVGIAVC